MIQISKTNLKVADKRKLFFESGGRCSICCAPLDYDVFSRSQTNVGENSHIIGDSVDGPRGGTGASALYAGDIHNIILLCPTCHTKVDKNEEFYTVDLLHAKKKCHTNRVRQVLDSLKNEEAHLVIYEAKIGEHIVKVDQSKMDDAARKSGFITHEIPVSLNPSNTAYADNKAEYWDGELGQLSQNFKSKIIPLLERGDTKPFLVFAIAPQPLLIYLGTLLYDTLDVRVFQKRREPDTWLWSETPIEYEYEINAPLAIKDSVAIKLSLSDNIADSRITEILGEDVSIWNLTHANPHGDFLIHPAQLDSLRTAYRKLFQMIRERHGKDITIHVFPACPVSAAVEFGRIWMPKVDANMLLYDQQKSIGKNGVDQNCFEHVITLPCN